MKKFKKVIACITIILIFVIGFFTARGISLYTAQNQSKQSGKTLQSGLNNLGFLETAEYYYTHIATYDSGQRKILLFSVPLTNSKFIYSCDGVITAGVDFEKINIERTENVIHVTLPKAEIKNSEIDIDSFKQYHEQNNIFNPISVEMVADSFSSIKNAEKAEAIEKGLLTRADDNAKKLIENFIKANMGKNEYELGFSTADE